MLKTIVLKKISLLLFIFLSFCNIAAAADMSMRQISSDPFKSAQGKYAVGTTSFSWKANDKESYIGQIWYPAQYSSGLQKADYLPKELCNTDLAKQTPMVATLQSIPTDSAVNAPILSSSSPFPVLIYSPGLGLAGEAGTFFFEYLASRGYIVAAINHPGSSIFTENADGSFVFYQNINYDTAANKVHLTQTRAVQLSQALDALLDLDRTSSSIFFNKMDADRIGVFGHSIGGRTALRAASLDKRFKAAVNLDGSIEDEPPYIFKDQNILMMETDIDETLKDELAAGTTKQEEVPQIKRVYSQYINNLFTSPWGKKYLVCYSGTRHMNYTDLPLLLNAPGLAGSDDASSALLSMSELMDDFFTEAFSHPETSISLKDNFSKNKYAFAKLNMSK